MEDLTAALSSIRVIRDYLMIHRTSGLASLSFFKNLQVIQGNSMVEEK